MRIITCSRSAIGFQADFREFTMHAMGRQMADHADMEGQVSHALARQNHSVEERSQRPAFFLNGKDTKTG